MSEKVAIITAGGSGMGAAAARRLAADGNKVGIMSPSGRGEALAKSLGGVGFTGSNQNSDDLSQFLERVLDAYGRVDYVVNSAGHGPRGGITEMSDADWLLGMETYFMHVVRMSRLVTPHLLENGGAIVNISTYATFEPEPAFPTSAAFRASLAVYTKLYADEHAAKGIRMNNVLPGFINSFPEQEQFLTRIPTGRYGTVEEVAATVAFLLSDEAAYITGQNIRVDGGITRAV